MEKAIELQKKNTIVRRLPRKRNDVTLKVSATVSTKQPKKQPKSEASDFSSQMLNSALLQPAGATDVNVTSASAGQSLSAGLTAAAQSDNMVVAQTAMTSPAVGVIPQPQPQQQLATAAIDISSSAAASTAAHQNNLASNYAAVLPVTLTSSDNGPPQQFVISSTPIDYTMVDPQTLALLTSQSALVATPPLLTSQGALVAPQPPPLTSHSALVAPPLTSQSALVAPPPLIIGATVPASGSNCDQFQSFQTLASSAATCSYVDPTLPLAGLSNVMFV